jgi:hypothetical protein
MTPHCARWCLIDVVAFVFCVRGAWPPVRSRYRQEDELDVVATQDPRPWIPEITQ